MYLAAAELAKITDSMAFDAGANRLAQAHYVHAVQLATREAWGYYAQQGQVYAFHRAGAAAEDAFAEQVAAAEPRWLRSPDDAELAGTIGARFRDLARHDPVQAMHAVAYIGRALDHRSPDRPRNRAMDLVGLARVHLLTGEPDRALVNEAIPLLDHRHPGRVARKLGDFDREAIRYADVPAVRETRTRLRDLVSA